MWIYRHGRPIGDTPASFIGRRKAKYESCPRLLLEQAVALRHTARYAEFLRLFEPSHHNHLKHHTLDDRRTGINTSRKHLLNRD